MSLGSFFSSSFLLGCLLILKGSQGFEDRESNDLQLPSPQSLYLDPNEPIDDFPRERRGDGGHLDSSFFGLSGSIFSPRKSREIPVSMFRLKKASAPVEKRMSMMRLKKNLRNLHSNVSMLRLRKRISQMRLRKRNQMDSADCEPNCFMEPRRTTRSSSKRSFEEPQKLYGLLDY